MHPKEQKFKPVKLTERSRVILSTIPEDWGIIRLGAITRSITKGTTPTTEGDVYVKEGIPFFKAESITDDGMIDSTKVAYITDDTHKKLRRSQLEENDILFTIAGTLGRVTKVEKKFIPSNINQAVAIIRITDKNYDHTFLEYLLRSSLIQKQIGIEKTIMAQPNLSLAQVSNFKIIRPVLEEQQKIASILSNVDSLIQKTQKEIEQTQRLKKGLTQKLFTKGIGHTKFRKTDFSYNPYRFLEIPENWNYIQLGKTGDFINGLNKEKEDYGYGCLHVNIDNIFEGFEIDLNKLGKVNATDKEIERYKLEKHDILLLRSSVKLEGVGYPVLFSGSKDPVVFSGFIIRFRPNQKIWNPVFLTHLLRTDFVRWNVKAWATVSANVNINQESYKTIPLPCPPLKEQEQITFIITNLDSKIRLLTESKFNIEKLKKGLMQKLLTGQIRVKV